MLDSDRKDNVAIAAYDLGEFCRFHSFGKTILEGSGAKKLIMKHAKHDDS
jgi:V-type H+-transporting ATPase subunit H